MSTFHALAVLIVALVSAPFRQLPHLHQPRRPAALASVEVQIHLGDPACVAELETIIWKTLTRAARTWAPLPLPLDRVVVGAAFPAAGRADIYEDLMDLATANAAEASGHRRVVVSLGVRDGARDLDGWEIAGALAAQVQALVDERCRQHMSLTAPAPAQPGVVQATTRVARAEDQESRPSGQPALNAHPAFAAVKSTADEPTGAEVPSLAELLATVQKGQPLVAAGPGSNGTHP